LRTPSPHFTDTTGVTFRTEHKNRYRYYDGNGNWNQVQTMQISVQLQAGNNTVKFFDSTDWSPDIDRIVV
jgi:hypothetical protein